MSKQSDEDALSAAQAREGRAARLQPRHARARGKLSYDDRAPSLLLLLQRIDEALRFVGHLDQLGPFAVVVFAG